MDGILTLVMTSTTYRTAHPPVLANTFRPPPRPTKERATAAVEYLQNPPHTPPPLRPPLPVSSRSDVFADMLTARGLIGGFGLGVSVLIGVVYLLFLRIPGVLFLLIWGLLFAVWAILAGSGAMLFQTAETWAAEPEPRVHDDGQINAAKYLSYVMFGERGCG